MMNLFFKHTVGHMGVLLLAGDLWLEFWSKEVSLEVEVVCVVSKNWTALNVRVDVLFGSIRE
jgi:hypothetical protein